jgi:GTP:adenosylcobinamide-phosphate guanylyltransferase
MKAVIVAAGRGTRLEAATDGAPKCLVQVGGRALITRALDALEQAGVRETVVVIGHRREEVEAAVAGRAETIVNPFYATTNNMASLWLAIPHVWDTPFLYLHADIAFDAKLLGVLARAPPTEDASLLVDALWSRAKRSRSATPPANGPASRDSPHARRALSTHTPEHCFRQASIRPTTPRRSTGWPRMASTSRCIRREACRGSRSTHHATSRRPTAFSLAIGSRREG